jgi:hypothetical protein
MPVDWDLQARVLGEEDAVGGVRVTNVSASGLAVKTAKPLGRDAVLKVSFAPSDGGHEVQAYATVAWCLGPDQPQCGLRFIGIGEDDQERIAGLVERWLSAGGRPGVSRH